MLNPPTKCVAYNLAIQCCFTSSRYNYVGKIVIYICNVACVGPYCHITERSVFTALSLVGFVLHCLMATGYKRRVREEDYDVHRVVEEVYDRYLSQRPTV